MLAAKPLVAWTIEAAQQAKRLTDYLVSSDALLIMDIAKNYVPRFLSNGHRNLPPIQFVTLRLSHMRWNLLKRKGR